MSRLTVNLTYSQLQHHIFFENLDRKFRVYPKGRRSGVTRGAASAYIEKALEGKQILWGDVSFGNIKRYFDRYFLPVLNSQRIPYHYSDKDKVLKVGGPRSRGFIDFRSAEHPEAWEGFGYHEAFLNEAGIILDGQAAVQMYTNSLLPMLADFSQSTLCLAGVPKGFNFFHEVYQIALSGDPQYCYRTFTSYDTPFVSRDSIQELERAMLRLGGQILVDQEIYGKFVDATSDAMRVIPRAWVEAAMERWKRTPQPKGKPDRGGLDIAAGGADDTTLALCWGTYFGPVYKAPGTQTPDGPSAAAFALPHLGPLTRLNVDVIGVGLSAYDTLKQVRPKGTVIALNAAEGTDEMEAMRLYSFRNVRALMWWRMREALDPQNGSEVCLPPDDELLSDLIAATWRPTAQGIQIEEKDQIRKRLGRSTNKGDAVVMANLIQTKRGGLFVGTA